MKYTVMIPAAGSGNRMEAGKNKLFLQLDDRPILIHTLLKFEEDPNCSSIILAIKETERLFIQALLLKYRIKKVSQMVTGGQERQQSVHACLEVFKGSVDSVVLVHDGARPFVSRQTIVELVQTAYQSGAAIAAVPVKDTTKIVVEGKVQGTPDRETLWSVQTPQAFRYQLLFDASEQAIKEGVFATDESMLIERLGYPVQIVKSTYENIKMTTPEDLVIGEVLLKGRNEK